MVTREDEPPPLIKGRLATAVEAGSDETDLLELPEEVHFHPAEPYRQESDLDEFPFRFEPSTVTVIRESQLSLVESLSLDLRPTWFRTTKAAILQMETLKKDQRVRLLEELLNRVGRLLACYRDTLDDTLRQVNENEIWNHEPAISRARWVATRRPMSVGTDIAERLAESQLEAERVYGEEFATVVAELRRLVSEET